MKRAFGFCLAFGLLVVGLVPLVIVTLVVKFTSKGPVLYWSDRIGRNNRVFSMPKYRTMRLDSPEVASHLLTDPEEWLTPVGSLFRRTSLDELPQLWSILIGDMTFVGPRPALYNQDDLIALRTFYGVHKLTPGLTGWAQVNGRDESPIPEKVRLDEYYLRNQSIWFDLKIIATTFLQVVGRKGTSVPDVARGLEQGEGIPGEAYLVSAATWYGQNAYDRAIADCNRAIELAPDSAVAYNNRGVVWAAKWELENAIADFETAIRLSPSFTVPYQNRGVVFERIRESEKALADFVKADELLNESSIHGEHASRAAIDCQERAILITEQPEASPDR